MFLKLDCIEQCDTGFCTNTHWVSDVSGKATESNLTVQRSIKGKFYLDSHNQATTDFAHIFFVMAHEAHGIGSTRHRFTIWIRAYNILHLKQQLPFSSHVSSPDAWT